MRRLFMRNWDLGVSSALFSPDTILGKLRECSDAGFECIELGMFKHEGSLDEYVESIGKESEEANIKIWSIHLPFGNYYDISEIDDEKRSNAVNELCKLIDAALPLHPQVAVIHGSYEPIKPEDREDKILACIESLKALVEKCREYGMKLAIECLPRTCIGNCSSEMLRILEEVDDLYVCFDTNHLTIENPVDFVKNVGKYIITTHVSDYDGIDERHWLPGKGCIQWYDILSNLEAVGYKGPILFEVTNKVGQERITPKMLADNWYALIDEFNDK